MTPRDYISLTPEKAVRAHFMCTMALKQPPSYHVAKCNQTTPIPVHST